MEDQTQTIQKYEDRTQAGHVLARELEEYRGQDAVILALPRGGVPVAYGISRELDLPLNLMLVRKIGTPGYPEYGVGALAETGVAVIDKGSIEKMGLSQDALNGALDLARHQLGEQIRAYRETYPQPPLKDRTVILVDDGLATGGTALAAIHDARARGASQVILAVPVGAPDTVARLQEQADRIVCPLQPDSFQAVGLWYQDFDQTPDREVHHLLDQAQRHLGQNGWSTVGSYFANIPAGGGVQIQGDLNLPADAKGLVVFAHGSGSSRFSSRNRHVAAVLGRHGLATLLIDLLTPEEEQIRSNVFDIPLLADRLSSAVRWAHGNPLTTDLPIGLFGASTGGGAALWAAADSELRIKAVVSRGGRPDLAMPKIEEVQSPTLLIVGGEDHQVIDLNRQAQDAMKAPCQMKIVPGATHLFEEPGALDLVADAATEWFLLSLPQHKGIEEEPPLEPKLTRQENMEESHPEPRLTRQHEEEPPLEPRPPEPIEREEGPGEAPISS